MKNNYYLGLVHPSRKTGFKPEVEEIFAGWN